MRFYLYFLPLTTLVCRTRRGYVKEMSAGESGMSSADVSLVAPALS